MSINIQTLMSVPKVQVAVIRSVKTPLEATLASVNLAIVWQVITVCVMVSSNRFSLVSKHG